MSELPSKRVDIYPFNVEKSNQLAEALGMTHAQMVNYLIESADIQQLTKITFTDKKTKRTYSIVRTSQGYKPNQW